jgi:hypothetical protein
MEAHNAPCDYTHTGSSKGREVNLELYWIMMQLLLALHVDITKAAKCHGLGDTL